MGSGLSIARSRCSRRSPCVPLRWQFQNDCGNGTLGACLACVAPAFLPVRGMHLEEKGTDKTVSVPHGLFLPGDSARPALHQVFRFLRSFSAIGGTIFAPPDHG